MILLWAIAAGLLISTLQAWRKGRAFTIPTLRLVWLVPLAFLPQWLVFFQGINGQVSKNLAAWILVISQAILLLFALLNWEQPGFWLLSLGVGLNLLVILLNGGLMPVCPQIVAELLPDASPDILQVGQRLGKNVVLSPSAMRMSWLSDCLLLPTWFPARKALSMGDVFIAAGVFWLFWSLAGPEKTKEGLTTPAQAAQ